MSLILHTFCLFQTQNIILDTVLGISKNEMRPIYKELQVSSPVHILPTSFDQPTRNSQTEGLERDSKKQESKLNLLESEDLTKTDTKSVINSSNTKKRNTSGDESSDAKIEDLKRPREGFTGTGTFRVAGRVDQHRQPADPDLEAAFKASMNELDQDERRRKEKEDRQTALVIEASLRTRHSYPDPFFDINPSLKNMPLYEVLGEPKSGKAIVVDLLYHDESKIIVDRLLDWEYQVISIRNRQQYAADNGNNCGQIAMYMTHAIHVGMLDHEKLIEDVIKQATSKELRNAVLRIVAPGVLNTSPPNQDAYALEAAEIYQALNNLGWAKLSDDWFKGVLPMDQMTEGLTAVHERSKLEAFNEDDPWVIWISSTSSAHSHLQKDIMSHFFTVAIKPNNHFQ